jgi:hypothetical protein
VLYARFYQGKKIHFIHKSQVDLASDAVWKPGMGTRYAHKIARIRLKIIFNENSELKLSKNRVDYSLINYFI